MLQVIVLRPSVESRPYPYCVVSFHNLHYNDTIRLATDLLPARETSRYFKMVQIP